MKALLSCRKFVFLPAMPAISQTKPTQISRQRKKWRYIYYEKHRKNNGQNRRAL